jgi:hypothetical protein
MTQCDVWQPIFNQAFGGFDRVDSARMDYLYVHNARARHAIANILRLSSRKQSEQAEYLGDLERFYLAIQAVTGCSLIVDTSKLPSYSYFLSLIPALQCYSLHLVRDSRAVAYSWQRKKAWRTTQGSIEHYNNNIFKISQEWNNQNALAEFFGRTSRTQYQFLRYEDFVADPERRLRQILDFIKHPADQGPLHGHEAEVNASHILGANPNRFDRGTIRISLDDAWKSAMLVRNKAWVTMLTLPLLLRYRYSVTGK